MNNVNVITEKIIADANKEAAEKISVAEAKAADITFLYKEKAQKVEDIGREKREKDALDITSRAESSAANEKRNAALFAKGRALDAAFDSAVKALYSLDREKYLGFMLSMLKRAVTEAVSAEEKAIAQDMYGEIVPATEYIILLSARDMALSKELVESVEAALGEKGKKVSAEESALVKSGGFILSTGDIRLDCTLESVVASQRGSLEAGVLSILFN